MSYSDERMRLYNNLSEVLTEHGMNEYLIREGRLHGDIPGLYSNMIKMIISAQEEQKQILIEAGYVHPKKGTIINNSTDISLYKDTADLLSEHGVNVELIENGILKGDIATLYASAINTLQYNLEVEKNELQAYGYID